LVHNAKLTLSMLNLLLKINALICLYVYMVVNYFHAKVSLKCQEMTGVLTFTTVRHEIFTAMKIHVLVFMTLQ